MIFEKCCCAYSVEDGLRQQKESRENRLEATLWSRSDLGKERLKRRTMLEEGAIHQKQGEGNEFNWGHFAQYSM